jgi:hypothetical protein
MFISPDSEADLRWYYNEAAGACGLRSPFGLQLDMLRQGILPSKHERTFLADLAEDIATAGQRANRIATRLSKLPRNVQRTLELHYGARVVSDSDVSVALACATQSATSYYAAAVEKAPTAKHTVTRNTWFLWLCTKAINAGTAEREIQDAIMSEARQALQIASCSYEEA